MTLYQQTAITTGEDPSVAFSFLNSDNVLLLTDGSLHMYTAISTVSFTIWINRESINEN